MEELKIHEVKKKKKKKKFTKLLNGENEILKKK